MTPSCIYKKIELIASGLQMPALVAADLSQAAVDFNGSILIYKQETNPFVVIMEEAAELDLDQVTRKVSQTIRKLKPKKVHLALEIA